MFFDENYQASRGGHFINASEALLSNSFARELPPIFVKVNSSTSSVPSSSTHVCLRRSPMNCLIHLIPIRVSKKLF